MHPYYADGATGRFLGIWISIRYAVFTVGGPAFLALSAGEISNPRRTIPRVAKLIVWRVCGLYVMGALAVGIICPSRNHAYLEAVNNGEPGAGSSPWVFGIRKLGITVFLPDAINFMILLSGLSCGNTFLYTASRSLYSLAQNGQAPKVFLKCSKRGIPYVAGECLSIMLSFTLRCADLIAFQSCPSLSSPASLSLSPPTTPSKYSTGSSASRALALLSTRQQLTSWSYIGTMPSSHKSSPSALSHTSHLWHRIQATGAL